MKRRSVEKGSHNYNPGHGNIPCFKNKGFKLTAIIPKDAWFDPTASGPLGRDGKDWNKLGGVSFINPFRPKTWKKNSCSAIIAWRPSEIEGRFEVCGYTNDIDAKWSTSETVTFAADELITCFVTTSKKGVTYSISLPNPSKRLDWTFYAPAMHHSEKIKRFKISVPVGPWFGGNKAAPKSHYIESTIKLYH